MMSSRYFQSASALIAFYLAGCTQAPLLSDSAPAALVVQQASSAPVPIHVSTPSVVVVEQASPRKVVSLDHALQYAMHQNPALASSRWSTRISEARVQQAGLIPNPELEFESEGRGLDERATTTLRLSQRFELGGKRAQRLRVAGLEQDLAQWNYEAKRLDVMTATRKAFIALVVAQERAALSLERVRLAEEVQRSVAARVEAGKVSPVEETQARVLLANTRLEQQQAAQLVTSARRALALLWGENAPRFERASADLNHLLPVPSIDTLEPLLMQNPDLARWQIEIAQRQASVTAAQSQRYSDIAISGGVQRVEESNDTGVVLGIAVPLPIFDRNQGAIREARYALSQAETERAASIRQGRVILQDHYEALNLALAEVNGLRASVLPAAENAFRAATEGYRKGKFGYLDVLESQRTLFDAHDRQLNALQTYHTAVADIERLIGTDLAAIITSSTGVQP